MNDYRFEVVWPNPPDELRDEVIRFWLNESAITEGVGRERAAQLVVVGRDPSGHVAAVSTAQPCHIANLGFRCFFFRSFVGRDHRVVGLRPTGLIQRLIHTSYQHLNARFQQGLDADVLGLYFEIENKSTARNRRELVWTDLGANIVFVGILPQERQARAWYFESARLP